MCCCFCLCVEKLFKVGFQEVVDYVVVGRREAEEVLADLDNQNKCTTTCFRWSAWVMMILGHFLLFSPIIALFKWIPLVGWLLGGVLAVAAFVFALLWGTIVHLVILTVAWIRFRPLFGALLLSIVGIAIVIMFTVGDK